MSNRFLGVRITRALIADESVSKTRLYCVRRKKRPGVRVWVAAIIYGVRHATTSRIRCVASTLV